jgi:D-glycero-alpha-D-manno-heptose-7-phosphate kinase
MRIRAKAPLRVSFAGGGTDVPPYPEREGGCVLNATIDNFAWGSLRPRQDGKIRIESVDLGISIDYTTESNMALDGELDIVKAVIHRMGAMNSRGFDIFLHSDAPPGSGLGSSSALIVALVGLIKEFKNISLTQYEIAELAYRIEREDLAIQGGHQDQYAASFGGFNFIEFHGTGVVVTPLRISSESLNELEHNLLLCYTGQTRRSDRIIQDQTHRLETGNTDTLSALRLQKQLAIDMKNALLRHDLNDFGDLLHSAWEAKKRMSTKISNPMIDELYAEAMKNGALGGKITGAGGGGFILFYCQFENRHKVATALKRMGAQPAEFAFEQQGMQTWRVREVKRAGATNTFDSAQRIGPVLSAVVE